MAAIDDPELLRLLDAYAHRHAAWASYTDLRFTEDRRAAMEAARAALLAHIAARYVRRDRLYPDPLDDPAYHAALDAAVGDAEPPPVAPAVPRRPVTVRIAGRRRVESARHDGAAEEASDARQP